MIDGDIEPVIYVVVRAPRVSMSAVVLMLFGRMFRIFMYRPDKVHRCRSRRTFPLSHVDSTSSRVFDRPQGANFPQQTTGRLLLPHYIAMTMAMTMVG